MNHANKDFQIKSVNFQSDRQTSRFSQLPRSPIVSSSELEEIRWEQVRFVRTSELNKEKRSITTLKSGVVRRGNR
ncbi:MAG: hypothetical protein ACRC2S_12495 [Waterburya sp.]